MGGDFKARSHLVNGKSVPSPSVKESWVLAHLSIEIQPVFLLSGAEGSPLKQVKASIYGEEPLGCRLHNLKVAQRTDLGFTLPNLLPSPLPRDSQDSKLEMCQGLVFGKTYG